MTSIPARALVAWLLLLTPVAAQNERARALEGGTRVPTCDTRLQRRLEAGFASLRSGALRDAVQKLLPAMKADGARPQLQWGPRQTRDFFELLAAELAGLPQDQRKRFTSGFGEDAARALRSARLESGARRETRLRAILRAFPGSPSARSARTELVDLALERGDALDASFHFEALGDDERAKRRAALRTLLEQERGPDAWPNVHGAADGLAVETRAARAPTASTSRAPKLLGSWPQRATWQPERARGVVGSLEGRHALAVFQDAEQLLTVVDLPGARRLDRIALRTLTGLPPDRGTIPSPAIRGSRLFLVHGGGAPALPGSRSAAAPAAELFALDFTRLGTSIAWRFRPRNVAAFGTDSTMLPRLCVSGDVVYALVVVREDRLTRRVHALALDTDGKMLWQRQVAKGVTLTAELLTHRQEAVRAGRMDAARPALAKGRLFVETGLGVTACLEARSGAMLWSFRTARIGKLRGRESAWDEGRLAEARDTLFLVPSDGTHSYRLRVTPGSREILARVPELRGNRTLLLGVSEPFAASYWWRSSLLESAPGLRRLEPSTQRALDYTAPPLDRGDRLASAPLLTHGKLVISTRRTLASLDLSKDLYYEHIFDLSSIGRGGFGPALPFGDGVVFACDLGPLYWAP